jgi:hypothetical protein
MCLMQIIIIIYIIKLLKNIVMEQENEDDPNSFDPVA